MHNGSPFRVGVDGYNMAMARGTGVATYGRVLGRTLNAIGHPLDGIFGLDVDHAAPQALREVLFFGALSAEPPAEPPKLTLRRLIRRSFISPMPRHLVEVQRTGHVVGEAFAERLPAFDRLFTLGNLFDVAVRYFRRYRQFMPVVVPAPPAVMHWTYPVPVHLKGAANVYTIHDLVPLRLPHTSTEDKRYHFRLIETCLREAAHVCTVSEASRNDILAMFPATDPARVTNTYQAVTAPASAEVLTEDELRGQLRNLFDLALGDYFLYFGALEPKKNIGRLIEAYLSAESETPLVIVGGRAWRSEHELRLLNGAHGTGLRNAARIRQLDYLPESLLMRLVRGARAVLLPSLYEGFGLPVLEAMMLGVPVMTSITSSLPEVAGDSAVMVDPYSVASIAKALRQLDSDAELRARLSQAGPQQAAQFSTGAYMTRLTALYSQAMAAHSATQGPPWIRAGSSIAEPAFYRPPA
ncbi:glycosyltransferase family 1 protein [Hyphomicrobium sp. CS1BSMeth3]|uniref:glycosyltransferase family 4 protein n=1 Tax=Hyphomicrobium sp. CS1BSMeth3 TaxID=1892844 RepID=UPI0009317600|nr:glycosyltransferase family 1 protein [Hyphomicrobium sp. CS1BSMeth3]